MSIVDPFFHDKNTESFNRAIVWIKLDLSERTQEWCSCTSRWAVDQYVLLSISDAVYDSCCTIEDALDLSQPFSLDYFGHELWVLFLTMTIQ